MYKIIALLYTKYKAAIRCFEKGKSSTSNVSDRIYIEQGLERRISFKDIAKDLTTISKEIRFGERSL